MTALAQSEPLGDTSADEESKSTVRVMLLVEDSAGDARLLQEMLSSPSTTQTDIIHVTCMGEAEEYLAHSTVDAILLDLGLPDVQGLDAVRKAQAAAPNVPLLVLTGLDDESVADQALQEGAQDYLIKNEIEPRTLHRALRYAMERKRLDRLKDEFVATVSHELRTPLTSISGSLGLLMGRAGEDIPQQAARLLAIAHANSQRLVRLVDDILDIEKMEAGQVAFRFNRLDVRPHVEQAIEANKGFAAAFGVRIRLEQGGSAEVRADPDRLLQVLTNLLSNACKFSPRDDEVLVSIDAEPSRVRISVLNHGPSISPEFKPHVFEKFAQADATNTRRKGGTGLGLSIVKKTIERMDGEVGFFDAPGGGTVFYVDLPSWAEVTGKVVDLAVRSEALRILLCEDDPDLAIVIREQLREIGLATDFAHSMGDALIRALEFQYSAFMVDLHLPDGDGVSLILRLRELPQYEDTPIVVVSADPDRGRSDKRSQGLNVLGWLRKPVDLGSLMQTLIEPPRDSTPWRAAPGRGPGPGHLAQ